MVSLDTVFDLLSNERRRYALYYLDEQEGQVSIEEVAEQVAKWEADGGVPEARYDRIELSLHHAHLPKTTNADFIEYDSKAGEVYVHGSPDAEFDTVLTVAEVLEGKDESD